MAVFFVQIFQCWPIPKVWSPLLSGHCIDQKAALSTSAAINTFSDFVILIVPLANVWRLQLNKKERVGLIMILSFGALYVHSGTIIASV